MAEKKENPQLEQAINEEFNLNVGEGDLKPPTAKKKATAKSASVNATESTLTPRAAAAKFIDPEDDRENWPVIRLESENEKPNYEFVSVQGTKRDGASFAHNLQIMREVDVAVPPSVVYALQDAVSAHYIPVHNPATGKKELRRQNRSSLPWVLVSRGKYC